MKEKLNKALLVTVIVVLAGNFDGCKKEEVLIPSTIQFNISFQNVVEGNGTIVLLTLDRAVSQPSSLELQIVSNATYNQHYSTSPSTEAGAIKLDLEPGLTSIEFQVTTIDNATFDNGKYIRFKLANPSEGLKLGLIPMMTLNILDDEGPSIANFEYNSGIVNELDTEGMEVTLLLSAPAGAATSLDITISTGGAHYGTDFITSPAASNGKIALDILPGDTSATFVVLPVHNFAATQSQQISFSMIAGTDVVKVGTKDNYSLTIINVDTKSVVNFAASSGIVAENNSSGITIELPFSAEIPADGNITITITTSLWTYGYNFTTVPASIGNSITLDVAAHQEKATFKVFPVNDSYCGSQTSTIDFHISYTNGPLERGTDLDYSLTITNDDVPIFVSFAQTEGSTSEGGSSVQVQVNFSAPAPPGQLYLSTDWGANQSRLISNPPYDYDCYWYCDNPYLSIAANQTSAIFSVTPIPNTIQDGDFYAHFGLSPVFPGGCVQMTGPAYSLTIADDD